MSGLNIPAIVKIKMSTDFSIIKHVGVLAPSTLTTLTGSLKMKHFYYPPAILFCNTARIRSHT